MQPHLGKKWGPSYSTHGLHKGKRNLLPYCEVATSLSAAQTKSLVLAVGPRDDEGALLPP